MNFKLTVLLACFIGILSAGNAAAQENQVIPLNQQVYRYIKNFQQRGYLLELNPTAMPYTKGDVYEAMQSVEPEKLSPTELFWYQHIKRVLSFEEKVSKDKQLYVHGMLSGGFDLNNTNREDGARPLKQQPYFFPYGALQLYMEAGNFGGQLGLRHDLTHFYDRDGLLPYGRLYVRSEDFYFGYRGDYLKVYYGRLKNQWGLYDKASAILSDNPTSYDNISFTFGNNKISVQGVYGQLDNLGNNGSFGPEGNLINGQRRFVAFQRVNWRPVLNFQLSLIKADLYSSTNSSISLKYFNPFNELFFDRTGNPVNDYSNTFVGGLLWFNKNKVTIHGQAILDDVHVTNREEQITMSIIGSLVIAQVLPELDLGIEAEFISYQSYNTSTQKSTRFVYLKKGLATPFNDYVSGKVYGQVYLYRFIKGLMIQPSFTLLYQGEQEINQPFYRADPDGSLPRVVLTGTVERTLRSALRIFYNPIPEVWLDAEFGYNSVQNKFNSNGLNEGRLTAKFEAGFRLTLDGLVGNK